MLPVKVAQIDDLDVGCFARLEKLARLSGRVRKNGMRTRQGKPIILDTSTYVFANGSIERTAGIGGSGTASIKSFPV